MLDHITVSCRTSSPGLAVANVTVLSCTEKAEDSPTSFNTKGQQAETIPLHARIGGSAVTPQSQDLPLTKHLSRMPLKCIPPKSLAGRPFALSHQALSCL